MPTDATAVIQRFLAAVNRRSTADLGALVSDDHAFIDAQGRALHGRAPVVAAWQAFFDLFPDYEIRTDRIISDGALVAIFGAASGTFRGKHDLAPENRIAMPTAWQARVADGRVTHWQVYADWSEALQVIARATREN